jgi:hypothetical protein
VGRDVGGGEVVGVVAAGTEGAAKGEDRGGEDDCEPGDEADEFAVDRFSLQERV